jgi:hypothetical protein
MTIRIAFPHPRSRCSRDLSLERKRCWEGHGSASRTPVRDTYAHSHITKPILSSTSSAIHGDGCGAVVGRLHHEPHETTGPWIADAEGAGHQLDRRQGAGSARRQAQDTRTDPADLDLPNTSPSPARSQGEGPFQHLSLPRRGRVSIANAGEGYLSNSHIAKPILGSAALSANLTLDRSCRSLPFQHISLSGLVRAQGEFSFHASPFPGRGRVSIASAGEGYLCG